MNLRQRHGEQQRREREDQHVKQPDARLRRVQFPAMHRRGERGANRPGRRFLRQQHGREHDDEDRADVGERDLHGEREIGPRVRSGGAAEPFVRVMGNHAHQPHGEQAEVRQLAPHGFGQFVSKQRYELGAAHDKTFDW